MNHYFKFIMSRAFVFIAALFFLCVAFHIDQVYAEEPEVVSIAFSDRTILDNSDFEQSVMLTDNSGSRYKYYYCYRFEPGDKFYVTFSDGTKKEYSYEWGRTTNTDNPVTSSDYWDGEFCAKGETSICSEITITSDQQENHWLRGEHKFHAEYKGAECDIKATVMHYMGGHSSTIYVNGLNYVKKEYSTEWTGRPVKPTVRITGGADELLEKGTDYTLSFGNNIDMGRCSINVHGIGTCFGTMLYFDDDSNFDDEGWPPTFVIRPKGTKLGKVSGAKKSLTVSWKKQATKMSKKRITGYQVQISTDKKFSSKNRKTYTVKGYKTISKKIGKLKAKKKYYVRVRTYFEPKKVGKVYSTWSKVKSVKTR